MTIVKSPALTSALEAIAMPGVLIDHRTIAEGDEFALLPEEQSAFARSVVKVQRGETLPGLLSRLAVSDAETGNLARMRALQLLRPGMLVRAEVTSGGSLRSLRFLSGRESMMQVVADGSDVYVGTSVGVWKGTLRAGETRWDWRVFSNGLPEASIHDLAIARAGGTRLLRAGVQARGVWEVDLAADGTARTFVRVHRHDVRRAAAVSLSDPERPALFLHGRLPGSGRHGRVPGRAGGGLF